MVNHVYSRCQNKKKKMVMPSIDKILIITNDGVLSIVKDPNIDMNGLLAVCHSSLPKSERAYFSG